MTTAKIKAAIEELQSERLWTGVALRNMQDELSEPHTREQYAYLNECIAAQQLHLEDVDTRIASLTEQLSYEATIAVYEDGYETDSVITYTANFATIDDARKFVDGESVDSGEIDVWNVDQDKYLGTTFSAPYNGGTYYAGYTIRHNHEIVEYDDEAGFIA